MLQVDYFVAFDADAALKKATSPTLLAAGRWKAREMQSQITKAAG